MTIAFKPAGSPASNQHGKFTVHYASGRQANFIAKLVAERIHDLGADFDSTKVNRKHASALIDKLLACPLDMTNRVVLPISEAQVGFIQSLIQQKQNGQAWVDEYLEGNFITSLSDLDRNTATAVIETLKAQPDVTREPLAVGAYSLEGKFYAVRIGKESGNAYSLLWDGSEWVYARGIVNKLTPANRLSLDDARAFGVSFGQCVHCGRALKDAKSIEYGMGSTCRKKY